MTPVIQRLRSKTYRLSLLVAGLGAAQEFMPYLKEFLAANYGTVFFGIAVAGAIVRELTNGPISDK
jgi:hypothetical protein